MTREEKRKAIDTLEKSVPVIAMTQEEFNDYIQTVNQIMDWLEQQPCDDCISRQAVLEQIDQWTICNREYLYTNAIQYLTKRIQDIPPVISQPKMGKWIKNEWGNISCSSCGCAALYDKVYPGESVFGKAIRVKSTFCPTCGAKMQEVEE